MELIWDGKYDAAGKKVAPLKIALPFQTVETVNESTADRDRNLDLFAGGRETEWRNRLIWGDKKYVLPSLLAEFAGKVNLIYIDPPFDTGADFSFTTTIPDSDTSFVKEPSVIEQKAYRDTWGKGLDSYLKWFYETVVLLRDLLADDGSIYVHLDYHVSHYAKAILDEIFGLENFVNEITWKRTNVHSHAAQGTQHFARIQDSIFFYVKNINKRTWHQLYIEHSDSHVEKSYKHIEAETGRRYSLGDLTVTDGGPKGNPRFEFMGVTRYWRYNKEKMEKLLSEGGVGRTALKCDIFFRLFRL